MKRVVRILRGSAIVLSLLLLVTTVIAWVGSYDSARGVINNRNGYDENGLLVRRTRAVQCNAGYLVISSGHFSSVMFKAVGSPYDREGFRSYRQPPMTDGLSKNPYLVWQYIGFARGRVETSMASLHAWFIPIWFLTLLFSLLTVLWVIKRLRRKHHDPQLCCVCGYDLRATPTRCPECGNPAQAAPLPPSPSSL